MPPRHKIDNTVSLRLSGLCYEGWTEIRLNRDVNAAASDSRRALSEPSPAHPRPHRRRILIVSETPGNADAMAARAAWEAATRAGRALQAQIATVNIR